MTTDTDNNTPVFTGRCHCGATTVKTTQAPQAVAYCHCKDCRRWTSAPVAAFAAFDEKAVTFEPDEGRKITANPGVTRTFCTTCGSPLTGRYDYLPEQVYIGVSIFDQDIELAPGIHTHESERLTWLHIDDDLERIYATGRSKINEASK